MDILEQWGDALARVFSQLSQSLIEYLPNVLGAFLLLLIGWFTARALKAITIRIAIAAEQGLSLFPGRKSGDIRLPGTSINLLGSMVFWIVLLFFLTAATQILGLQTFTVWLGRVVDYLPTLVAGGLIVLAGFLLSRLARELVETAASSATPRQRQLFGQATQTIILVTAILVGADQIGIRITILVVIAATVAGSIVIAVALSLSLGARQYVANLIGSHYLRQTYHAGQKVRVAGFEGKILNLTLTAMVLELEHGQVSLPAKLANEEAIILLDEHPPHV